MMPPDDCASPVCLCGCGLDTNRNRDDRRFVIGHDQTARTRLRRLNPANDDNPNADDWAILHNDLLIFYQEHPNCRVVDDWDSDQILQLARDLGLLPAGQ